MHDVFMVSRNDQHPTNLAALRGARMVAVTETEEGRQWAEARVKAITGGDKISARVMRGDPFEFEPGMQALVLRQSQAAPCATPTQRCAGA